MKVLYLNDTKKPQAIYLHTLKLMIKVLQPAESIEVPVAVAEDQKVFVKVWDGKVLIGRAD